MRKNKVCLSLIAGILPILCFAQLSLTIEIEGLRNNKGYLQFELINEFGEKAAAISQSISDNICIIQIKDLKPGKYTFKYFHDENNNKELDTNWLGIPKEGFGFSNDPGLTLGPPSFEKTVFELKGSSVIKSKPKYF
ncbi:MAG: DUF2141 domain-containing protein [FCB group bacterium]|nr:DUF2141 domain-containing protein [FCB group bacterium]